MRPAVSGSGFEIGNFGIGLAALEATGAEFGAGHERFHVGDFSPDEAVERLWKSGWGESW